MAIFKTPSGALVENETGKVIQPAPSSYSPSPIAIDALSQQASPVNFQPEPNPKPAYPVASLGQTSPSAMEMTGPEQDAQELINSLQGANNELAGESAYRSQLKKDAGFEYLMKTQRDLEAQLKTIQNEGIALDTYEPGKDPELAGRGITTAGLLPYNREHAERKRQNSIRALGVNSLLEASRGNIANAMAMVDSAVEDKYGPLKAKIATQKSNLELILNSPAYTLADKKRAQAQKDIQDAKARDIARQEEFFNIGQTMAAAAIKLNPDNQAALIAAQQASRLDPTDPDYLAKVFGLLGQYQSDPNEIAQALADLEYKRAQTANIKANTAETYSKIGSGSGGGAGTPAEQLYAGLSSASATAVRAKVSKFSTEPLVQNFATLQEGYNFSKNISDTTQNPADDQALIYSLAKALDPGSVVREGEYATAQKYSQSWIKSYGKGVEQAIAGTGFLSTEARRNIKKSIEQKYQASKSSYDNLYKQYSTGINSLTGRSDGSKFLTDYAIPSTGGRTASQVGVRQAVRQKGYDYDAMRADGLTDQEIARMLGL